MKRFDKVIVIGLDGFDPGILGPLVDAGELPNFARLRAEGGFARLGTTLPAQTPVAFSTFATGTNPGGHGIFDFVRRDPLTYLPDIALNKYEHKNAFTMPRAVNLRRGVTVWELLREAGVAATVLRCPCTYPPDLVLGSMLSGMGVPDVRGGLGTSTFYTSDPSVVASESENVVHVKPGADGRVETHVIGPRNPKTRGDLTCEISVEVRAADRSIVIRSSGEPSRLEVREGEWSGWLKLKFKAGLLSSAKGMVRFLPVRIGPVFELYASPVNFQPAAPLFPISHPPEYARLLEERIGAFYTSGMVEDHGGLQNGRFDERAYLAQCADVMREREAMLFHELDRLREGLVFCLFDTPDRVQHMFWRFREPGHPANRAGMAAGMERVIEDQYRRCDEIVGRVLARTDDRTLLVVMSDHGCTSFQRGFHVNTWLHDNGLLALKGGLVPGEAGEMLQNVDWSRTSAYALGLGSIYLNLKGRESQGIVEPSDAASVATRIVDGLTGLVDPGRGAVAIRSVARRDEVYSGPHVGEAPDLVIRFAPGWRVSWATGLGGIPAGQFEDNVKRWSGDHITDPAAVPGVLLMNRPFDASSPHLVDLAPTILDALGVARGSAMEGRTLLR